MEKKECLNDCKFIIINNCTKYIFKFYHSLFFVYHHIILLDIFYTQNANTQIRKTQLAQ